MLECPALSDGDLLRRMRAGDEAAFTALYGRHQRAVFRFALQMSGSQEIAQEATQEVFMELIRNSKAYDAARGSLPAYLFGIARNRVFRRLEQERPYVAAPEEDARVANDPDFGRRETVAAVRRAVLALPPNYREVIVLCDLEEMDYAAAAGLLNCAVGTVRSRLHRARALLLEKMRAMGERCPV
jgi:RNA polymerase sigma-70 factor (ECF subfamily)